MTQETLRSGADYPVRLHALPQSSISDLDPLRDVVVAFHLDDPCELPPDAGRIA